MYPQAVTFEPSALNTATSLAEMRPFGDDFPRVSIITVMSQ